MSDVIFFETKEYLTYSWWRLICLLLFSRSPSTPCLASEMACAYFIPWPRMMSSVVDAMRFLLGRTSPFPPEKSNLLGVIDDTTERVRCLWETAILE